MEAPLKTEVLIVGAGPVGLSLAAQFLRYGIDFIIVDKKAGCTEESRALVVQARTLEIYDQIGLAQQAVSHGQIVRNAVLLHDGHTSAKVDFSEFGAGLSPFPFPLIFEQSKNEHLLYDHLRANGKEVLWNTALEGLTQSEGGVTAGLRGFNGEAVSIQSQFLVGCDGARSPVRHLLELGFEGSTNARLFYVADVVMEFEAEEASLFATFGRDSFLLLLPMDGEKHWRLIGNLPEYEDDIQREVDYEEIEAKVKALLARPLDITEVKWFSTYRVHTRHAEQFSLDRCFLAGDAAHVHTPVGGQGMNTGIQDAYNLAWKLALVLKGQADEVLLETYSQERYHNAIELLRTTDQVFEVGTGSSWYLQLFRDRLLPNLAGLISRFEAPREAFFTRISQIGLNYHDSQLTQFESDGHFHVKAGDRMPHFLVDGASIHEHLRAPKFHALLFTSHGLPEAPELESMAKDLVDFYRIELDAHISDIFGAKQPFLVLLRPDNYLAFITTEVSEEVVGEYLISIGISGGQIF